ncbi:MAG: hypothetical protein O2931_14560, partial [Planctomycetota bacterium]|nr:hypothetical protein [Planctomycetota bacterium]
MRSWLQKKSTDAANEGDGVSVGRAVGAVGFASVNPTQASSPMTGIVQAPANRLCFDVRVTSASILSRSVMEGEIARRPTISDRLGRVPLLLAY